MAILESQLVTWAKQGPIDISSKTYSAIKNALTAESSPIASYIRSGEVEIYLQGSYANDTNIRADSDIDVVVELTEKVAFHSNKVALAPDEFAIHEQTYPVATYQWGEFRDDVIIALQKYFADNAVDSTGNKSIKVLPNSGRLRADVVPVIGYRDYTYFKSNDNHGKDMGVALQHKETSRRIVNYPVQHYKNGVAKHKETNEWFKPTVRIFKNMVSYLVDNGALKKGVAPSYFLQCMIYNVPSDLFGKNYEETFCNVVNYLNQANLSYFKCEHEKHLLFGSDDTYWNEIDARVTISALIELWNKGMYGIR